MASFCETIKQICENYLAGAAVPAVMVVTVESIPPNVDITQIRVSKSLVLPLDYFCLLQGLNELEVGDRLMCIRGGGGQKYFLLGKVGGGANDTAE